MLRCIKVLFSFAKGQNRFFFDRKKGRMALNGSEVE
jgi:hypothetical protein